MVETISLSVKKTPVGLLKGLLKAKRIVNKFQPDIIHSHMFHANIFSRILRVFGIKKPLICTAHSINEGGKLRTLMYRYTDFLCDKNTNVSDEAVEIYKRIRACPEHKMIPVYNGIDTTKFQFYAEAREQNRKSLNLDNNQILLLAVGRLTEAKDYPNLFNALSLLKQKNSYFKLVVIGVGEDESDLRELSSHLGLDDIIMFLGARFDVQDWMSAADIFVMSSAWEGLPLVLLEAMSCQRPVVATDCGGTTKAISGHGAVVAIRNSEALACALTDMLKLAEHDRQQIGLKARKHVIENYSITQIASKWISIYSNLINVKNNLADVDNERSSCNH